ncbi:hypothetical protein Pfo_023660 [Paulownia fortunei]|nr:hypothetical protein Pfo_023660 [Paulownia fortunei]
MASKLHKLLSTLIFLFTILVYPATTTSQECPYPCYPPPTGTGNSPPVTTTPPVSTTPPASFSPPVSTSPPAGIFPFTPPTPYFFGAAPPPPEPILPWFPYYYRKPPHQDQSSSPPLEGSRNIIVFMFPLLLVFSFVFH